MAGDRSPTKRGQRLPAVRAPEEIHDGADWLCEALLESAASGHEKLVVDVSSTPSSDPAGLRLLVRAYERAEAEGRARGLAIPDVIVRRAPGIFWLSELARTLSGRPAVAGRLRLSRGERPAG